MEQFITMGLELLIPIVAAFIVGLIWKAIGAQGMQKVESELKSKKEYVDIAVRLVEQLYKDLHGSDKVEKAMEWLTTQLNAKGITFTEGELKGMIEAAIRKFKDEFGNDWANAETNALTPEKVEEIIQKSRLQYYTSSK